VSERDTGLRGSGESGDGGVGRKKTPANAQCLFPGNGRKIQDNIRKQEPAIAKHYNRNRRV